MPDKTDTDRQDGLVETDLQLAQRAVITGAAVALRHFGDLAELSRELKADGSVVTAADRAVETAVREVREEVGLSIEVGWPVTVVVDSHLRRVDVIFRVEVSGDVGERVGGEATTARWKRPEDVDEMDRPTRQILDAALAVRSGDGYAGRVVTG